VIFCDFFDISGEILPMKNLSRPALPAKNPSRDSRECQLSLLYRNYFFILIFFFLFVVSSYFIKISYKLQALEPILINIGIDSKPPLIFESSVFICSVMLLYKIYYKIVIIQQLIMYYILNRCSILGIYLPPC